MLGTRKALSICINAPNNCATKHAQRHQDFRRGAATITRATATFSLGLDFGTSGARATVIADDIGETIADVKRTYGGGAANDWAASWERTLFQLLQQIPPDVRSQIGQIAFDGTSATALLCDKSNGILLAPAKLYNETQEPDVTQHAKVIAPASHTATASTSTLCKLLTWDRQKVWQCAQTQGAQPCLLHQADWLASLLHGQRDVSDWNNALKVGFDPALEAYPDWLLTQDFSHLLPQRVLAPGTPVASILPAVAERTGLPRDCVVCAGTTDSIAAFIAAGVTRPGQAVTSLGSTLAVKLLSTCRVDDAKYGVYSHRIGHTWLVGGASNTGGAVLRRYFTDSQLVELTARIDPARPTGTSYYPLTCPGERFPINDPNLQPMLEPRPDDDALFLQGIFEGIARIEADAYRLLTRLGATPVTEVYTAGGGAVNEKWTAIRTAALGVPVRPSTNGEASYGAALLASRSKACT